MPHLTLQEVIDRINKNYPRNEQRRALGNQSENRLARPEVYIPRITRLFASILFGARAEHLYTAPR